MTIRTFHVAVAFVQLCTRDNLPYTGSDKCVTVQFSSMLHFTWSRGLTTRTYIAFCLLTGITQDIVRYVLHNLHDRMLGVWLLWFLASWQLWSVAIFSKKEWIEQVVYGCRLTLTLTLTLVLEIIAIGRHCQGQELSDSAYCWFWNDYFVHFTLDPVRAFSRL